MDSKTNANINALRRNAQSGVKAPLSAEVKHCKPDNDAICVEDFTKTEVITVSSCDKFCLRRAGSYKYEPGRLHSRF